MDLQTVGKYVALIGLAMVLAGGLFWLAGRLGLGSLPGDIQASGEGWSCYLPIATSILLSLLLTLILSVLVRFFGK